MFKRIISGGLAFLLVFLSIPVTGFAQSYSRNITAVFDNLSLVVDGQKIQTAKEPFIFEDRVYVASQDLSKALSLQAAYQEKTKQLLLTAKKDNQTVSPSSYSARLVQLDYQITALQQEINDLEEEKGLFENNRRPYRDIRSTSEMQTYLRDRFSTFKDISMSIRFSHYSGDRYRLYITFPYEDRANFERISKIDIEGYLNDLFYAVRDLYDRSADIDGYIRDDRSASYKTYVDFETRSNTLRFTFSSTYSGSSQSSDARKLVDALDKNLSSFNGVSFDYKAYINASIINLYIYFDDEDYYNWSTSRRSEYLDRVRRQLYDTLGRKELYGVVIDEAIDETVLQFRIEDNSVSIVKEGSFPTTNSASTTTTKEVSKSSAVSKNLTVWFDDISVELNDKKIYLSATPFFYDNQLYLPIADIADDLYLNYQYNPQEQQVAITTNGVLRGDSDQALLGRMLMKNDEINKLTSSAEELREQVEAIRKLPYPSYANITSSYRMETYLQDYFSDFEGISMDISFYRSSGSDYRLRITYPTEDFDRFDKINSRRIESWIQDIFGAIRGLYDPYAKVTGSIRNTPYSSVDITYITFDTKDNTLTFYFDDHGTQNSQRFTGSRLEDYLNRNYRRHNSVSFDYKVVVNRKDVDLLVYFNHSYYYDWPLYRKMSYLQLLMRKIEDEFGRVNINGRLIDASTNKEALRFSLEDGYVRSMTLMDETEKMLNKEHQRFTFGGNTFNFTYKIYEKDVNHFDVKIEGDFSKTDSTWHYVEENGMTEFKRFIQDALYAIQDLWPVSLQTEVVDQNLQSILTMDLYNTKVAAVNADPGSGSISSGDEITLTSATSAATIYYTLDGSTPDTSSNRYNRRITINGSAGDRITLKAYAVKSGMDPSDVRTFTYDILEETSNLTGLVISGSPSNFSFSPSQYTYDGITVASGVSSVTITPTGSGSITVDGSTVASGQASSPISLTEGEEKEIRVVHTESGKAQKIYRIFITRGATKNISITYTLTTSILGVFSGNLQGESNFSGYEVLLLYYENGQQVSKATNVASNGSFQITNFSIEPLVRIMGYRYQIKDSSGSIVKEGPL
ncbi:MAG: chitobiase/beta-hexosaminidase C-terminal domain-containing protein [Thermotaleaceae bacterium]